MDILGALESYSCAVRAGSLSGAARQRRMSQPAISQHITALESHYGTRLLTRGRSGVQMTQAGAVVLKHASAMLDERQNMQAALASLSDHVTGHLAITADQVFSHQIVGKMIRDVATLYPGLEISLHEDDHRLDLAADNIDLALRSGALGDGKGLVRKIGTISLLHVATPEYLAKAGVPKTPDDLQKLNYIQLKPDEDQIATPLVRGQETIQAPIKTGLTAQLPYLLFQALYGHLGFAKVPKFLVADALKSGQLKEVLPKWHLPEKDLFLEFPPGKTRSPHLDRLIKSLLAQLDTTPGINLMLPAHQLQASL